MLEIFGGVSGADAILGSKSYNFNVGDVYAFYQFSMYTVAADLVLLGRCHHDAVAQTQIRWESR